MKKIKKLLTTMTLVLTLAMVLPTILPTTNNISTVEAATVKINKTKLTLNVGQTYTLKIKGTKSKVKWSSSKKSIATVSSKGEVTAKKKGSTTITATVGGKKYTCKVTVKENEFADESFAAYSWVLLNAKFADEKVTVNEIQTGEDIASGEKAIIINYTLNSKKSYAYIRLRNGEATSSSRIVIFKLESDSFPNEHLNLNTFSYLEDLEKSAEIGNKLSIKDVKKLYQQYLEDDSYIVVS